MVIYDYNIYKGDGCKFWKLYYFEENAALTYNTYYVL